MDDPNSSFYITSMDNKKTNLINSHKILSLLSKNINYYFTIADIINFTGISRYKAEHILAEFETMELVNKRIEHLGTRSRYYYQGTIDNKELECSLIPCRGGKPVEQGILP